MLLFQNNNLPILKSLPIIYGKMGAFQMHTSLYVLIASCCKWKEALLPYGKAVGTHPGT